MRIRQSPISQGQRERESAHTHVLYMANACWQSKLVQPTAKRQIANGKQWLSTCPEWQMTDATWNAPFFSPTIVELTIIARHIHGHNLYEAITFHQLPQKQLRHVEDQHQVWIVREYALSHCTAGDEKKGRKGVRENENKWNRPSWKVNCGNWQVKFIRILWLFVGLAQCAGGHVWKFALWPGTNSVLVS